MQQVLDILVVLLGLLLPFLLLSLLVAAAVWLIRGRLRRAERAGRRASQAIERFRKLEFRCSNCGHRLPNIRRPRTLRQLFRGGWTCPHCGAEVDRHGQHRA